MTTASAASPTLDRLVDQLLRDESDVPWLGDFRRRALAAFSQSSLPGRRFESWRKVPLDSFELSSLAVPSDTGITIKGEHQCRVLAFRDVQDPDLRSIVERDLCEEVPADRPAYFEQLGRATYSHSALILAQPNVPNGRIELTHRLKGDGLLSHRVIVVVPAGAELTVLERFEAEAGEPLTCWLPHTRLVCGPNSRLNHVSLRSFSDREYSFHELCSDQERDSVLNTAIVHVGGHIGRTGYRARINQVGAEYRGIGIAALRGRSFLNTELFVEHHANHSRSSLLYRTVSRDRAHSVFDGNLYIGENVRDVDSHQTNNNLLLDRNARAESMPRLLIRAEKVSCEHGATVGEIDRDALFFQMARGLPEPQARALLIQGFLDSVLEEMPLLDEELEPVQKHVLETLAL